MSQYLTDFIEFFGLDTALSTTLDVQTFLTMITVSFLGMILTIAGIRCIFELIKILTDWSKFK